ncbi:hypothetical protein BJ165DRAFT_175844 [Panaeolus papilionaceus]|nr:hypothetical protein BJ165DRAFT_175844 [Panaeolus papilionaceus]
MEVIFNNKTNILNAQLLTTHDSCPIYTLSTKQTMWGRTYTYLRDVNPVLGKKGQGDGMIVGMINWKKKTMDVGGQRKKLGDVRRKILGLAKGKSSKTRLWQWAPDREEYCMEHEDEGWKITATSTSAIVGTLTVPYRPKLFGKTTPVVLKLSRAALARDEVFLILAAVYSEVKRGDGMVSFAFCVSFVLSRSGLGPCIFTGTDNLGKIGGLRNALIEECLLW